MNSLLTYFNISNITLAIFFAFIFWAKNITYLLISHDLNVVRILADRVAVMRSGIIVEEASCEKFFSDPTHPYSQELIENSGIK